MNGSNHNQAEREMASYLLGEMTDDEQAQLETRFLADQALFDQMLLVKQELIDAYVRHHLDAETREKFERYFLVSPEGQKEVTFAHALREKLNEPARSTVAKAPAPRWTEWFRSPPALKIGLAAAALLLMMIVSGWLLVENRKLRRELAVVKAEQASQLRREEELRQQIARLLTPTPSPAPLVTPSPERPAPINDLLAINLSPDARGDGQTIKLSAQPVGVRLNLRLNFEPVALHCHVTLQLPKGAKIERRNLRARPNPQGGFFVQADFPTTTIQAGNYVVTLTGRDADNNEKVAVPYRFLIEISGNR